VKNKLHTISIGQSTHWDLVKKYGLRRILFDRSCLRHIWFQKNLAYGVSFSYRFFLYRNAFDLKFLIMSTNSMVVKMIATPILSDHNDIACTKQQLRKFNLTTPLSNQTS